MTHAFGHVVTFIVAAADAVTAPARPTVIASHQKQVEHVAVDGSYVYWGTDAAVFRAPKEGGPAKLIRDDTTYSIAFDATAIYLSHPDAIWKLPKTGGRPVRLAGEPYANALSLDADSLYFHWGGAFEGNPIRLVRVPKLGGPLKTLLQLTQVSMGSIALDDSDAYVTVVRGHGKKSTIMRVPKRGGAPKKIYEGRHIPANIVLDATHVYFAVDDTLDDGPTPDGAILRVSKAGAPAGKLSAAEVLSKGIDSPWQLVVDSGFVYLASGFDHGRLVRVPVSGGGLETVLDDRTPPNSLAVDQDRLYWTEPTVETVFSLAKPGRRAPSPSPPK